MLEAERSYPFHKPLVSTGFGIIVGLQQLELLEISNFRN